MYLIGLFFTLTLSHQIEGLYYFMEMVDVEILDPEWFDTETADISIDFINDTFTGLNVNVTMIKDLPEDSNGHLSLYYKSMEEYSVSSGVNMFMPLCDWIQERVMLGSFLFAIGVTEENCPPKAGQYGTSLWYPPRQRMPNMMPATSYKVIFGMGIEETYFFKVAVYVEVTDSSA